MFFYTTFLARTLHRVVVESLWDEESKDMIFKIHGMLATASKTEILLCGLLIKLK
jgi:hypothetical protein